MKAMLLALLMVVLTVESSSAQLPQKFTNSIGMEFVLIPKGSYLRGSPPNDPHRLYDEKLHHVTLTKDFYLGVHEVTQQQFQKLMGRNPSHYQGETLLKELTENSLEVADFPAEKLPVESVLRSEAVAFCSALSNLAEEAKAGREYRLPTEAEWEYACRAESHTVYFFGDDPKQLGDYAWFKENSDHIPHPVGLKKTNRWGLYDIYGNVGEWCSDSYDSYPTRPVTDPIANPELGIGVRRGGAFNNSDFNCRSANRWAMSLEADGTYQEVGFRVALTISETTKKSVDR